MCLAVRFEGTGKLRFDLVAGGAVVQFAELHTDAGSTVTLRTLGRDPDDTPGNRKLFLAVGQR